MKKNLKISFVFSLMILGAAFAGNFEAFAVVPTPCKVLRVDCPDWFTGAYDTCITTGNSVQCAVCGQTSGCYIN